MSTAPVQWPDRMNPTDALFWYMSKVPEMRSTIGALMLLERSPSRARIRAEFERLSHELPRLRQLIAEVPFGLAAPEWVEDPQFDLDYHLRHLAVPAPAGIEELLDELSPLYAANFDSNRPLWEAYVAEGLQDGRGAIFVKMHHCLTDGVGGSRLFGELLSSCTDPTVSPLRVRVREPRATTPAAMLARAFWDNLQEGMSAGVGALGTVAAALLDPTRTFDAATAAARAAAGFGRELIVPRAHSPLHERRSLSRRLSTFEMSLAEIEALRPALNATINDVVLTVVSGAMHRWHTSRGADVHELRVLVPVNLRGAEDAKAGNRLALLAVSLPVGEPNPLRRLRTIQKRMGRVKADRRATVYPLMARVLIALPLAAAKLLVRQQTSRTNFVCTNVPGPGRICYLAGEAIERIYAFAPLVGDHPVAIALYSYRDVLNVGLDVDPVAMRDLPHFRDALQEAYAEILNVGRQVEIGPRRRPSRRGRDRLPQRRRLTPAERG